MLLLGLREEEEEARLLCCLDVVLDRLLSVSALFQSGFLSCVILSLPFLCARLALMPLSLDFAG